MKSKLIGVIIGAVLVTSVGTVVYKTKQPVVLPIEDITAGAATNLTGENSVPTQPSVQGNVQNVTSKSYSDDDEEDDDDYKNTTGTVTNTPVSPTPTPTPTPTTQPTSGGITLAQIAKHNTRTSCWSAVNGSVYDLTSWIPNHPGGEQVILSMCGIDGSVGYNGQHGSSAKPAKMLAGFKLGTLAK